MQYGREGSRCSQSSASLWDQYAQSTDKFRMTTDSSSAGIYDIDHRLFAGIHLVSFWYVDSDCCLLSSLLIVATATGECSITEVTGYLDTMARSKLIAVYSLLIIAELGAYWSRTSTNMNFYWPQAFVCTLLQRYCWFYCIPPSRVMAGGSTTVLCVVSFSIIWYTLPVALVSAHRFTRCFDLLTENCSFLSYYHSRHSLSSGKFACTLEAAALTRDTVCSSTHARTVRGYSHFRGWTVTYSETGFRSLFRVLWLPECIGISGNQTAFLATSTVKASHSQRSWQ
jgi:hypothetical protein